MYLKKTLISLILIMLINQLCFAAETPDPLRQVLSITDEQIIAQAWLAQLRRSGSLSDDPVSTDYLNKLGLRLAGGNIDGFSPKFHLINNNQVNAFAFMGANIAINSGLIKLTESESELASVIAHEIAHLKQKHFLRQIHEQRKMMPMTIAGTLAAMLIGRPDLMIPVLGVGTQHSINFTREHEKEADRIGIKILIEADFDPQGMPDFFKRMSQNSIYNSRPPDYLLTHPWYESRIADSTQTAKAIKYKQYANKLDFELIKTRLELKDLIDINFYIKKIKNKIKQKKYKSEDVAKYKLGYALLCAQEYKAALATLATLSKEAQDNFIVKLTVIEINMQINTKLAQEQLNALQQFYPNNQALNLYLIENLINLNQNLPAFELSLNYAKQFPDDAKSYLLLRQTAARLDKRSYIHYANAYWLLLHADLEAALQETNTAESLAVNADTAHKQQIAELKSAINAIQPLVANE